MLRTGVLLCLIGCAVSSPPVSKTRDQIQAFKEALEKSRTDDGVRLDSRILANPEANIWENSGKFQGDIVLDDEQIEALVASYAGVSGRAAYVVPGRRWPGNVMVYQFGHNEFNAAQQQAILRAMGWVEHFSCVRFRLRQPNEQNYVLITGKPDGCYARVGYHATGHIHVLNLARATPGHGCLNNIVIIHELLHNLGFFHMQSAYERYNYVRINWNNIHQGMAHNFHRLQRNEVNLLGLPYEYHSCMHYSTHAFSNNGQPTIVATRSFPGVMGHMQYVTHWDWVRLRRHYNCPGAWNERQLQEVKEEVDRTLPLMMAAPQTEDVDHDIEINDSEINVVSQDEIVKQQKI
ncbi:seminal metalloprotease 1-like [Maniola hyperantus]|uniref:seminal metalloprotease 1-like n=1 Tax=Aphantopus hyperantus TaxID=2795564 RepID=UPI001569F975|nr:seminal metalloprotease 1-like [Maniola hyperantus]